MTVTSNELYYDPYDFDIDADPHPTWKRMRDEAPLYYNEKYDFYALSRFDDVEKALIDWHSYISGKGTLLEIIKSGQNIPPGNVLFEDPPAHDQHRGLMSRVFTPKKVNAIEAQVRGFCARSLDELAGADRFDFVRDLGAELPMRTIGFLLGIPDEDQVAVRDQIDEGLKLAEGSPYAHDTTDTVKRAEMLYGDYIEYRTKHPSDDLMTVLLNAEFEDETGAMRRLTRTEVLQYVMMLSSAGNETTARLIGWTGKLLAENPDQRRAVVEDRALVPNTIEEVLRYEAPSPIQARYAVAETEWYGQKLPVGSALVLLNGSANRDERRFPDADTFDIKRKIGHHLAFGYGLHFCLGAALARLEGRVALDEVLKRYSDWEVDYDNAVQAHTSTVRGWEKLPVIVG